MNQEQQPGDFPHSMVICEWIDSAEPADNAEVEASDFVEPQVIYQVGLLVQERSTYITIAGAFKPGPVFTYDYTISIPRTAIRTLRVLHAQEIQQPEG